MLWIIDDEKNIRVKEIIFDVFLEIEQVFRFWKLIVKCIETKQERIELY